MSTIFKVHISIICILVILIAIGFGINYGPAVVCLSLGFGLMLPSIISILVVWEMDAEDRKNKRRDQ